MSLFLLVIPLMGAKACAVHVPNAAWYGTWSVPARFLISQSDPDPAYSCPSDRFGFLDPLMQFYGVPEWLDGPRNDDTLGTAPVNFSVTGPDGNYIAAQGTFQADKGPGYYVYHFDGVVFADRDACRAAAANPAGGQHCDWMTFGPIPGSELASLYDLWTGWNDGYGNICQNHWHAVALESTFHCAGGGGAGCVDHQTAAWIPYNSTIKINPCDWRPDACFVGPADGNGNCSGAYPFGEPNGLCCSCGGMPPGSQSP